MRQDRADSHEFLIGSKAKPHGDQLDRGPRLSTKDRVPLAAISEVALRIGPRVFAAENYIPRRSVIRGFFPRLLDLVWIYPCHLHSIPYVLSVGTAARAFEFG